jgi:hypothetical protein
VSSGAAVKGSLRRPSVALDCRSFLTEAIQAGPSSVDPVVEFFGVESNEVADPDEGDLTVRDEAANLTHRNAEGS